MSIVGNKIELCGKFDFTNKSVVENFDNHVKQSVPCYDLFQSYISKLSRYFMCYGNVVVDIGCSTGTLLQKMSKDINDINVEFYGIDCSEEMIKKAKENNYSSHINFINDKVQNIDFNNDIFNGLCVVSSMLCLQFLSIEQREIIVKKVYDALPKGGAFFLVEKVLDDNIEISDTYTKQYYQYKLDSGFTAEEIMLKDKSLIGFMHPLPLSKNIEILTKSGFSSTSIFFKCMNFVGILGVK